MNDQPTDDAPEGQYKNTAPERHHAPLEPTLLKALLTQRHWQTLKTFALEWDKAAKTVDPQLVGTCPSRSQFYRWLGGQVPNLPHPDACRILEAMFPGHSAQQLFQPVSIFPTGQSQKQITAVPPKDSPDQDRLVSPALLATSISGYIPADVGNEIRDQAANLLRRWVDMMNRREFHQLLAVLAVSEFAVSSVTTSGVNAEELERVARTIASPSRVDEQVIDHIETTLRHCKRQDDALGSRAVLNTVLAQRNLVHSLLAECPANLSSRLLSIYSDMSASICYYLFDLNDLDNARRYGEQARAAAHEADNADLGVYALCEMSDHASWYGRAHAAVDLAAAAQSLARKAEDRLTRVCAAIRAGQAYAVENQYNESMAAFERAQDELTSAGQVSEPAYFINEGYLARRKSQSLLCLGKPQEAAVSATTGLLAYDKSFVDGYAACSLHLGNAQLQSGEVEEAVRIVVDAVSSVAKTRSARLIRELQATRLRMQPWQNTQAVKELDEHLATCGLIVFTSSNRKNS